MASAGRLVTCSWCKPGMFAAAGLSNVFHALFARNAPRPGGVCSRDISGDAIPLVDLSLFPADRRISSGRLLSRHPLYGLAHASQENAADRAKR